MSFSKRQDALISRDLDDSNEEEADAEDVEEYPPWLADVARECPYTVDVLEEDAAERRGGYIKCKGVELPDATDYAQGKPPRRYKLKRYSTVLVLAGPDEAPYIGLIDQIWRKAAAVPVGGRPSRYQAVDFQLECYWFYRRSELPHTAWVPLRKSRSMPVSIKGARYANSSKEKPAVEQDSPRQMHWLGLRGSPPERYTVHHNKLIRTREPGFVVQGFLWCEKKSKTQLAPEHKRVFPLDGSWPDAETAKIVEVMCNRYQNTAASLKERNRRVIERYRQTIMLQQLDTISSEDEEQQQQRTIKQGTNQQQSAAAFQAQQSQHQQRRIAAAQADSSSDSEEHVALAHKMKGLEQTGQKRPPDVQKQQPSVVQQQRQREVMPDADSSSDSDDNVSLVRRMRGIYSTKQPSPSRQQQQLRHDPQPHDDQQQKQPVAQ